ncbi:MAG: amino acid adenylation domain-containing protein, partial [Pyrinomonadaceae bacterium]
EEASGAYNDSVVLKLGGRFDPAAMRNAIRDVVNRHEALRTTFSPDGDYQQIHPSISIDVPLTDVSHLRGEEREQRIEEEFLREAHQVFDPVRGPLLRARFIKSDEEVHLIVLTVHHIVTDGVSNGILMQEIGSLYSAYCGGVTGSLPEPMQYSEYAQSQAELQNSEQMAEAETYWLAQFSGQFPLLDMRTDRPRPSVQTYAGTRLQKKIDKAAFTKLKNFGAQQNCTLFMTLLAGYAALLHRLSDREELVVGIPVAGQTMMGGKPLVGYCVNLVPLRSSVDEDVVFVDFLKSIKKTLLDAHHHYIYPFSRLAKKLDLPRDPSRAFPISAVFNLDRREKLSLIDFEAEVVDSPISSTKFDLYLNITETDDELLLCLEYNADLFDAETVGRWLDHLTVLLQGAALDPGCRVVGLPLLSEFEERRLLVKWNETTADYSKEMSLHRLFEEQVERNPQAVAVVFGTERVSYQELNERANQMARYLRTAGVENETIVGLGVERSTEMVVSLLGIMKAGAAYLPLDKEYPAERLAYMLRESGARKVVGKRAIEEKLKGRTERLLLINEKDEEISRQRRENLEVEVRPENPAYVIFTSGSTGMSKGVVGLHGGAINRLQWMWRTYPYAASEVCCQKTSLGFLDSLCEIFGPLLQGLPLVLIREQDVKDVGRLIEILGESEVSRLVVVPSLLRAMLDWDRELGKHLPKLKLWVTSGEALSTELLARFKHQVPHGKLLNLYGMSEASADVTWADLSESAAEEQGVTIGRPISNTKIYVLNRNMEPVPIGVSGEVFVGGAGLARGYLNRPNLTAERFIPDRFSDEAGARLYRTGDLARWIGDGNIEYLGRVDEQVKIRGIRIEPAEIELALTDHEAVKEAVVVAREGENGDQRLVAYVVSKDGKQLRASEVKKHLRGTLPGYMVPSVVKVLEEMPLNESGKIDRKRLPEGKIRREDVEEEFVEPLSKVERQLAEIWEEVLPVEKVGAEDNFFDLGGDSILAIQIVSRASQAGLRLTPKDIFERRTIAELAETIEAVSEAQVDQGAVEGAVPLTPIQHWFFEQELAQPHHFNQANLLRLEQPIEVAAVKQAVGHLLGHHDALRLRFIREGGEWRQYNAGPEDRVPFRELDLTELSDSEVAEAIAAECGRLQASLDLGEGPIIQVEMITLGRERGARLLVVIHHLAVDIVSWGIIVEDLSRACEQLSRGEGIKLAAKTTSFKQWAERLAEYGGRAEVEREVGYWLSEQRRGVKRLPVDNESGENSEGSAQTLTVEIGEEETRQLLQEVPRAYRTQLSEVLLAALAEAVSRWSGEKAVLVEVEGHGREESLVGGVDLTRTVGWFTSIYPVLLEVGGGPGPTLKRVKEQMRGAPGGGLVYGLLRYLGRAAVIEKLRHLPQSQISFN